MKQVTEALNKGLKVGSTVSSIWFKVTVWSYWSIFDFCMAYFRYFGKVTKSGKPSARSVDRKEEAAGSVQVANNVIVSQSEKVC